MSVMNAWSFLEMQYWNWYQVLIYLMNFKGI